MKKANQENRKKGTFFGLLFLKVIPLLLLLLMLAYTLVYSVAVQKTVKSWQSSPDGKSDSLVYTPEEWQLIRDKAFLTARIKMADDDSIGLTINLEDSLIQLENKGVVLRQVKFQEADLSKFFKAFKPVPYVRTFSHPFQITEIEGSIVKNPITVKKAPKDTIEAAQNVAEIDTSNIEFVEWHLQLDSAFRINIVQSDQALEKVDKPALKYRFRQHYKELRAAFTDMIHFRKPTYYPEITISIPRNEAKSFFRALPSNGKVVLKL